MEQSLRSDAAGRSAGEEVTHTLCSPNNY